MTTALQIIDRAYSLIGFKAAGEPLSGDDATYALDALNSMIDGWNTQSMFIASVQTVIATVSTESATIGTGLTFNTERPVSIEDGAFSRLNGVDYPMTEINRAQYADISLKTVSSTFPQYFYYDPAGVVYFYPVPSAVSVHLPVSVDLAEFVDTGTEYTLHKGYRKALEYSLAEELAPGVKELSSMVVRTAANARRAIRRSNVVVPVLDSGLPEATRYSIYSGL